MNKVIKYFLIIINLYCIIVLFAYGKILYQNNIKSSDIKITYNNIINEKDEYLINIKYKNPKTKLYCSIDNKNWININECNINLKKGNYTIYIKNNYMTINKKFKVIEKYEGTINSNIDMLDEYYLAINGNKKIELEFNYPENYDTSYKWIIENKDIIKVENDTIYGLKAGESDLTVKLNDGNKKIFKIIVTNLIVPPHIDEKKQTLTCNRYTEEENELLDKILASRIKEAGE